MTHHLWWREWALSPNPALALLVLQRFLPAEVAALIGVQQNPKYHPEGDAFLHTTYVVEEAVRIAQRDRLRPSQRIVLVMAALCHDLGKAKTTKQNEAGDWVSPKHDSEGYKITVRFLRRLGFSRYFIARVAELVKRHMVHGSFVDQPSPRMVKRLVQKLADAGTDLHELGRLIEADASGRPPLPKRLPEAYQKILTLHQQLAA